MKVLLHTLVIFIIQTSCAQDMQYAREIVNKLSSARFWGRGYTKDGMKEATKFLSKEFKKAGIQPMKGDSYLQSFSYPVNTFPGKMEVELNGKKLKPGKDFIISPESQGLKAKNTLLSPKDSTHYSALQNKLKVTLHKKLTWGVSQQQADYTWIQLDSKQVREKPQSISINIENKFIPSFQTANVCGMVKGKRKPDSIILITAHYDHLGGMGKKTFFPGANDNASGVSLLLNLASYYSKNPQPYTMAFICFSGEEAGLVGSKFFTEHPPFPLSKIRFLVNLDLTGTGDEGITVVNAKVFKKDFDLLNSTNKSAKYLPKITERGKSSNSDHHWFTEKNIPSFFIYTLGGIKAYHDIEDKALTLPLAAYPSLFKLLTDFNGKLMGN